MACNLLLIYSYDGDGGDQKDIDIMAKLSKRCDIKRSVVIKLMETKHTRELLLKLKGKGNLDSCDALKSLWLLNVNKQIISTIS